jgi:hypothetical protein
MACTLYCMDNRVYLHLTESIRSAPDAATLAAARHLVGAASMHPIERQTLERLLTGCEAALRGGDAEISRATATRAD